MKKLYDGTDKIKCKRKMITGKNLNIEFVLLIAMKQAAKRPAPGDHNSLVSKQVAMAVRPEKRGARNTQTSRIVTGICNNCRNEYIEPIERR